MTLFKLLTDCYVDCCLDRVFLINLVCAYKADLGENYSQDFLDFIDQIEMIG